MRGQGDGDPTSAAQHHGLRAAAAARRARRGRVGAGALVSAIGGLVVILPILHLCGAALLFLGGPILAAVTFRVSVLTVGEQQVACPKCDAAVPVDAKSGGWPVRLHCGSCGSTFSARP
jgi:ribosomal protein S27AE